MTNPGSPSSKTLYRDVGNGNGIGRLNDVEQIGANGQFIVAKGSGNQYYILEMTKDDPYMDARDVMLGPMDSLVFVERLRSLGIADLTFSQSFIR